MATITTSAYLFYKAGSSGVTSVVGWESSSNRVGRFTFTSPSTGASAVTVTFGSNLGLAGGSDTAPLRFYITTSSTSHANAGAGSAYHGTFSINATSSATATGSASVLLLPNTTYYLWCFPGSTTYAYWYWRNSATITTSGGAGLVKIDNGSSFVNAIPYIDNGSSWVQAMPYIDNGSSWKLCS